MTVAQVFAWVGVGVLACVLAWVLCEAPAGGVRSRTYSRDDVLRFLDWASHPPLHSRAYHAVSEAELFDLWVREGMPARVVMEGEPCSS